MSAGYAERLSEYPNKGVCGLPENYDSQRAFTSKLDKLAQLIQQSKYTVVLTGAGISTSAGIPDFRGPSGIWTREQQERKKKKKKKQQKKKGETENEKVASECVEKVSVSSTTDSKMKDDSHQSSALHTLSNGRKRKQSEMQSNESKPKKFISFETALPTYTHKALTHLILHPPPPTTTSKSSDDGSISSSYEEDNNAATNTTQSRTYLHYIVTQNVDGLHRKASLPRNKMSVLHGCIFTEICDTCNTEHFRKKEIQSIGLQHTGGTCSLGGSPVGSCPGKLKDTLLDWEDALPEMDWWQAQEECGKADLVLCLGTSLRIEPAGSLCTYATPDGPDWGEGDGKKKKGRKKAVKDAKLGYAIVNLQQTPYDDTATLVIRGKVDDVMKGLMGRLGYGCASDESNWASATGAG